MRWWIKLIFGLTMIALLIWLALGIGSFTLNLINLGGFDIPSEPDPMFASEPETITMPPDLFTEEGGYQFKDNSANWDTSVQTPVDKTAEELGRETSGE